jgi:uncharacterized protein (DUF433 family)
MNQENKYLGKGVYSLPFAAKLLSLTPAQIKRYVSGYSYGYQGTDRKMNAIFNRDLTRIDGRIFLSFLDLIELKFIAAFRQHGVSTRAIRIAAENVHSIYKIQHPFCTRKFMTDGRTILTDVAVESNDPELLDLVKEQYAVAEIFKPYLHGEFEFEDDELINRWWPNGKDNLVLMDPKRCFGQPIIDSISVPTETLFAAFRAEDSIEAIIEWFGCRKEEVEAAIKFELKFAA